MAKHNIPHVSSSHMDSIDSVPSTDSISKNYQAMNDPRAPTEDEEAGEDCMLWSFYNSVFFSFTSITTIGYGRMAPQTQLGRGVLLLYSFIGIPINGILIGTVAAFFSIKVGVNHVA